MQPASLISRQVFAAMRPSMRGQLSQVRRFAAGQSAAPETPLHFYQAQPAAIHSINHRMFYPNWVLVIFLADAGYAMLDI
uniref:Uncharacterized protein n=1 Tax=Chromera velia CCMP2878 TaxID=1169474 RepID=A0A0G4HG90_9ALVE|mmetsp:Transcript_21947/g.43554  ORF Transcript_21947/g.43554 Transcript_21947/m.43554 type:complete len:80 (-) Transcript_21947:260-499(-)|eukprot:Cvel_27142.t1-p1 / transcript=Cvel_27142.t1 / gene=Cvel_27142 / organism=Chromera_velia_CCMP2878 / gene_product=hypothetical protein / transcript_product=hypothetical protein / location=Cvel_scaffold3338:2540-3429(+) / protein_length=79 / sequence_SO=supercontig / SO=protein_coding / is_pseudo=false